MYRYPPSLGFVLPSIADSRSMYRKMGKNPPVYIYLLGRFELRHRIFARNRCTVTVSGKYWYPLRFVEPSVADFRSMYCKLAKNPPVYLVLAVLDQGKFEVLFLLTHPK